MTLAVLSAAAESKEYLKGDVTAARYSEAVITETGGRRSGLQGRLQQLTTMGSRSLTILMVKCGSFSRTWTAPCKSSGILGDIVQIPCSSPTYVR